MFDGDFSDTDGHYELSSIEAIRDAALIMYGRFLAHLYGAEPVDEQSKTRHQYLSIQETENIVREHSHVSAGGMYAIGGDTPEEAKAKVNELLAALMDRVMSNVISEGVKQELFDCSYDTDVDDFTFSVTEKGHQIAKKIRNERTHNVSGSSIEGNQEL